MPNKTLYVPKENLPVWEKAQSTADYIGVGFSQLVIQLLRNWTNECTTCTCGKPLVLRWAFCPSCGCRNPAVKSIKLDDLRDARARFDDMRDLRAKPNKESKG